jgi:hypothetical protein
MDNKTSKDENESQKKRSVGCMRKMGEAVVRGEGEGTRCENVSRERLVLIEVEVGARELDQDELVPQPVHRGGVGDVDRVRRTSATSEEGNELALGIADDGSRVPAPRGKGREHDARTSPANA